MGEIIHLRPERARDGAEERVVVAVADGLYPLLATTRFVVDGCVVDYVPASTFGDPSTEADLWIGPYVPSAPGRRLFFQTLSGATYEFDERRLVYRSGELVWPKPLADYGIPSNNELGILRVGSEAALLFLAAVPEGWQMRVRVTTRVVLLAHLPPLDPRVPTLRGWLALARKIPEETA